MSDASLQREGGQGRYDVHLLLVADRIKNSGKISPQAADALYFHGSKAIYLLPYAEDAIALREAI
jgi:hypothetical protein